MNAMSVKGSMGLGFGVLAVSAVLAGLESMEIISGEMAERGIGIVLGLLVIAYANAMPKMLVPIDKAGNDGRRQALQRFAGWTLFVGGIGYVLAFLILPMDFAAWGAVACGLTALAIVIIRCVMLRMIV